MTDTPRLWGRRADETPKSYAAFRAYVALGGRRSVREALLQNSGETAVSGKLRTWEGWSARHKWVSRSLARDVTAGRAAPCRRTPVNIDPTSVAARNRVTNHRKLPPLEHAAIVRTR